MGYDRPGIERTIGMFQLIFQDELYLESSQTSPKRSLWYVLHYRFSQKGYEIVFESEGSAFNIQIHHGELFAALMRIQPYDNEMTEDRIKNALLLLKSVLQTKIRFYKVDGMHLYQEDENGEFKLIH